MAIFHLTAKIIKRSHGQSAVACAAYRRGAEMRDERTGKLHNYLDKDGIAHSEVRPSCPCASMGAAARGAA